HLSEMIMLRPQSWLPARWLLMAFTISLSTGSLGPAAPAAMAQDTTVTAPPAPTEQAPVPAAQVPAPAPSAPAPPAPAPAPVPDSSAGAASSSPDGGWPRSITTGSGATIILYQPQIASWEGQKKLVAMAALSYTAQGATKPQVGTMKLSSPTSVSTEDRMVSLTKLQITEIKFSSLGK